MLTEMNKFIKYIAVSICSAAALSSCSFLEITPTTQLSANSVFSNEATAKAAMLGVYDPVRVHFMHSPFTQAFSNSSLFQCTARSLNSIEFFDMTMYSTTLANYTMYTEIYSGISKCNQFIEELESSPLQSELKAHFEGEARILRAMWHFQAVRLWGNVPLVIVAPRTDSEANRPRASYLQVYKAILDDLDYGFEHAYTWAELGDEGIREARVPNYAAKALKVKVLVQMACLAQYSNDQWFDLEKHPELYPDFSNCGFAKGDYNAIWNAAYETAKDVIANGPFKLEGDYFNLFRYDPVNYPEDYLSRERIICIPNTPKNEGALQWVSISMPKYPVGTNDTSNNSKSQGQSPVRYTWEYWNKKYGEDNLIFANTTVAYAPNSEVGEDGTSKVGNYHYYEECGDPRIATVYWYDVYQTYKDATQTTVSDNKCYPNSSKILFNPANNAGADAVQTFRKGVNPSYRGNNTAGDADFYVLRYADILLLAAECAAVLDKPQEAVDYVNQVLTRARKSTSISQAYPHTYDGVSEALTPANWNVADYGDKNKLIKEILMERIFELEHEQHDWFDNRRRGAQFMIDNFIKPINEFNNQNANYGYMHTTYMQQGRQYSTELKKVRAALLCAFPDTELRYNTSIGYENQNDFIIQ